MGQEPRGLHRAIERALNLAGADALLAGAHEVDDLQPQVQREVAVLKDRAYADGEFLAARVALAQPVARQPLGVLLGGLGAGVQRTDLLSRRLAMRAHRASRPKRRLDVGKGCIFVVEVGFKKDRASHGNLV